MRENSKNNKNKYVLIVRLILYICIYISIKIMKIENIGYIYFISTSIFH